MLPARLARAARPLLSTRAGARFVLDALRPWPVGLRPLCTAQMQLQEMEADHQAKIDADSQRSPQLGTSALSDAVHLLLEQEDQGVAADATQDLFISTVMQDSKLHDAVLG
jgi:hypothetical protein